ncbi:MAG: hypothetical protein V4635_01220 [Bacteroidota bacterium]
MKKIINLFFALCIVSFITSCNSSKEESIVAPQGMNVLELGKYGKPFAIFIPDTANAKLEVVQQSYGALDIKVGKNFAISINEQAADIELKKKDVKEDEVNKLKSFITEEPNAILWESEIMQPEFHFLVNQKIGNTDYSFEDIKSTDANPFGKEAIQKMFDSSKNIKEIKAGDK